ncbi:MAG TPA: UDP-N-acetylmuramoyl-tripeptide--D-alanyl-D-alanine ligase [Bacteroidales bacterium]|nr:UDP-N-acetylmuramoyl-tripeptide--D-alanyl-D-alanine ligase [Bacteroidales bacterium]
MKTEQLYKIYRDSAGVTTDTRNIGKGQIFFALRGANFNGNSFASEAIKLGASFVVIDDPNYQGDRTILVDDSLRALQSLATFHRQQLHIPVLAITGTNGKTTTKELIAAVLSKKYRVHYTKGNLNNHIGVPLTILSAPEGTEMMIIEMGANHRGEIRTLCTIALPDYGIITNIGTAHIEGFGSFEGVIKTKTELYAHLRDVNGIVLYNDLDQLLASKIAGFHNRTIPYSFPGEDPLYLEEQHSGMNLVVSAEFKGVRLKIETNLFGGYNFWNVKAAVATGLVFKVDINEIAEAIAAYTPSNNRSQVKITRDNTLICDSYNANPSSMSNAIGSFSELNKPRKMVILGDMLELGQETEEEHAKIIRLLQSAGIDDILLTGKIFMAAAQGKGIKTFPDVMSLSEYLKTNPVKGYTILIKGSRGIGLEKIYDLL